MHNTSKRRQSQGPYNKQSRRKVSTTVSSSSGTTDAICDAMPLYATSSWLLPPTITNSLEYRDLSQASSPASTQTATPTVAVPTASTLSSAVDVEKTGASSTSPSSSSMDSFLLRGWSPVPTSTTDNTSSHWFAAKQNSQNVARKRKRQHPVNGAQEDPNLDSEPPSAKRKQTLPSPYKSDASSMASSVYPSPIDVFAHEIDTRSSCDYLSAEPNFDASADCMPDSPNSLRPDDDCVAEEYDEVVSVTTSPSSCSIISAKETAHQLYEIHATINTSLLGERTPGQLIEMTNKAESNASTKFVKRFDDYTGTQYNCMTPGTEPEELRQCPLPALSWANADDVWQMMCKKDQQATCLRTSTMLERHPSLQPRMRAILLDWLIEVCDVYKMHRETFYLAADYLDRYLAVTKNIQKTHLQLIGITCLFVAAKVEEIYPPKIAEFAYVTDGACREREILKHEVLLLQALEWNINPVTAMSWLGIYMQLNVNNRTPASFRRNVYDKPKTTGDANTNDAFIYPQFSGMEFVQTAQLLDLCSLDLGMADYSYAVSAAAAMSHTFNREIALRCSGFDWQVIEPCARWMQPFFQVVRDEASHLPLMELFDQISHRFGLAHFCPNILTDESHFIQTHTITMDMYDRLVQLKDHALAAQIRTEASPATGLLCPEGLLTPPASSRKPIDVTDVDEEEHQSSTVERIKHTTTVQCTNAVTKTKNTTNEVVKISAEKHAPT